MEFSIEKDREYNRNGYHIHAIAYVNDETNLFNQLARFIGGNEWIKETNWESSSLRAIHRCRGKYGEVDIEDVEFELALKRYINKEYPSKLLVS